MVECYQGLDAYLQNLNLLFFGVKKC